ncbi:hypothetical protein N7478_007475 [Penicillium angulare]|uniref:uncharacterized protein n=1 Tax=Penicillium angulare TaxID=116970 RepID=UPI002540E8A3|nr:uncharacterized protein N7478_007475 [Penicillium angulare]KAJ5272350.1 hypothetical protein N7478_007475 [Penicillium angulare]
MSSENKQGFPAHNPLTSYWLKDPHPLASFRSSEYVPHECDIAIIGTGLAGVATAYHILSDPSINTAKLKVVLLEARQACSGATGRNGGHLKLAAWIARHTILNFGYQAAEEVVAHQLNQLSAIHGIAEKENIDCELRVTRSFDVFFDESHASETREFISACKEKGVAWAEDIEWIEASRSDEITGMKNTKGALGVPAVSLWPYKLVTGLLEKVLELGGKLYTETYVEKVEELRNYTNLTTSRGSINARKTIFATNAYTAALLPQFEGVITPFKGQNSHLSPIPSFHPTKPLDYTYNLHFNSKYADYLNPRPDNGIILGGGKWTYEDKLDRAEWWNTTDDTNLINDASTEHFDLVMETHFQGWEEAKAQHDSVWTGIMGQTPDSFPHIGRVPGSENQWLLAGFNGAGMTMICTASRGIARMVLDERDYDETGLPKVFKSTFERLGVKNSGFASD